MTSHCPTNNSNPKCQFLKIENTACFDATISSSAFGWRVMAENVRTNSGFRAVLTGFPVSDKLHPYRKFPSKLRSAGNLCQSFSVAVSMYAGAYRGGKGGTMPQKMKSHNIVEVFSSIQYIGSRKRLGSNMGHQTCVFPGVWSSLVTSMLVRTQKCPLCWKHISRIWPLRNLREYNHQHFISRKNKTK